MNFPTLVNAVCLVHDQCTAQANRAVNVDLMSREWVISMKIHEYEQNGVSQAQYGWALFGRLAQKLKGERLKRLDKWEL